MDQPLPAERYRRIEELLRDRQVVRVSTLSDLFGVSEVTVRRDLEVLERRGMLERTHGGAVRSLRMRREPGYGEAAAAHPEAKRSIGRTAAAFVEPGATVFLNGGTTTLQVFRHVDAEGVRFVTNHVGLAGEAAERGIEVLLIGGRVRSASNSAVGPFATQALRQVFATVSFIGVEGISLRSGLTTPTEAEAEVARLMIERTRGDVIVVADATKIGVVADVVIAPLDRVTRLVVDADADPELTDPIAAAGVEVVRSAQLVGAGSELDG
jgi:DeoR family fructose operon transcriptional repressor